MHYVITGASSFLGIELTKCLMNRGHSITAVCRFGSSAINNLPKDVDVVYSDMSEYILLADKIKEADVFINLAWNGTGHEGRNDIDIQTKNINFTIDAMEAAKRMQCKLFVESGSQAEYGTTNQIQDENICCDPKSEYGKAKLAVKEKGFEFAQKTGLKYAHLRIFSLFGENDHPWTLIMSSIDKMLKNMPIDLSSGLQNWNYLYVQDAALQISLVCEVAINSSDFTHEVFNIASDDTRILRDYLEELKSLTNSTSILNYGVINSNDHISLQPSINKLNNTIGNIEYHKFSDIILNIVKNKSTDCI